MADVTVRLFPALMGAVYLFPGREDAVMKNRIKQREHRRQKEKEDPLDKRDCCGVKDLTAYNAVNRIITKGRAIIALR